MVMKKQQPRKNGNGKPATKKVELGEVKAVDNIVVPWQPWTQIGSSLYSWMYSMIAW